jgi:hypothetical protein
MDNIFTKEFWKEALGLNEIQGINPKIPQIVKMARQFEEWDKKNNIVFGINDLLLIQHFKKRHIPYRTNGDELIVSLNSVDIHDNYEDFKHRKKVNEIAGAGKIELEYRWPPESILRDYVVTKNGFVGILNKDKSHVIFNYLPEELTDFLRKYNIPYHNLTTSQGESILITSRHFDLIEKINEISSKVPQKEITKSDLNDLFSLIKTEFGDRLKDLSALKPRVWNVGQKYFSYGTLYNDAISFGFFIDNLDEIEDKTKLDKLVKKWAFPFGIAPGSGLVDINVYPDLPLKLDKNGIPETNARIGIYAPHVSSSGGQIAEISSLGNINELSDLIEKASNGLKQFPSFKRDLDWSERNRFFEIFHSIINYLQIDNVPPTKEELINIPIKRVLIASINLKKLINIMNRRNIKEIQGIGTRIELTQKYKNVLKWWVFALLDTKFKNKYEAYLKDNVLRIKPMIPLQTVKNGGQNGYVLDAKVKLKNHLDKLKIPYKELDEERGVFEINKIYFKFYDKDNKNLMENCDCENTKPSLQDTVKQFIGFVKEKLNLTQLPTKLILSRDTDKARQNRSFGYFDPNDGSIWVYVKNRNTADILRTLAHELVHRKQEFEGKLDNNSGNTGSEVENEANALAGVLLRDFGQMNQMIYEIQKIDKKIELAPRDNEAFIIKSEDEALNSYTCRYSNDKKYMLFYFSFDSVSAENFKSILMNRGIPSSIIEDDGTHVVKVNSKLFNFPKDGIDEIKGLEKLNADLVIHAGTQYLEVDDDEYKVFYTFNIDENKEYAYMKDIYSDDPETDIFQYLKDKDIPYIYSEPEKLLKVKFNYFNIINKDKIEEIQGVTEKIKVLNVDNEFDTLEFLLKGIPSAQDVMGGYIENDYIKVSVGKSLHEVYTMFVKWLNENKISFKEIRDDENKNIDIFIPIQYFKFPEEQQTEVFSQDWWKENLDLNEIQGVNKLNITYKWPNYINSDWPLRNKVQAEDKSLGEISVDGSIVKFSDRITSYLKKNNIPYKIEDREVVVSMKNVNIIKNG